MQYKQDLLRVSFLSNYRIPALLYKAKYRRNFTLPHSICDCDRCTQAFINITYPPDIV